MKYYDPKKKELKTIIKNVDIRNKIVADIGAGYGRLTLPLAKYAKKIVAIEKDKRLTSYLKRKERENIEIITQKAETYLKNKKFDVLLLAWPQISYKWIETIKKAMNKNSIFIFTTCDNKSEYERIVDKIGIVSENRFKKDIKNKQKFIAGLPKKFRLIKKKKISTTMKFPNEKIAAKIIKDGLKLWFKIILNKKAEEKLKNIVNNHRKDKEIIFKEEVYFYLLKLRKTRKFKYNPNYDYNNLNRGYKR